MSANPNAYRDLAQVYAEEVSAHHRGVLRTFRRCGMSFLFDRCSKKRPPLAAVERAPIRLVIANPVDPLEDVRPATTQLKSSEASRRAGRRGGAATRARWRRIMAEREAKSAA
jgi:hypothetical protein